MTKKYSKAYAKAYAVAKSIPRRKNKRAAVMYWFQCIKLMLKNNLGK